MKEPYKRDLQQSNIKVPYKRNSQEGNKKAHTRANIFPAIVPGHVHDSVYLIFVLVKNAYNTEGSPDELK